jgi:hypothetical protein
MPMNPAEIESLIKASIPDAQITIEDLRGDGDHYAAYVVSQSFKGKSRVQQHQTELQGQEPRAAAPDGLSGPAGPHGQRVARLGAADLGATRGVTAGRRNRTRG